MFPRSGFTKGEVINYYIQVASYLLPHLYNRPITFKRFPNGVDQDFFYEKNAPKYAPKWIKTVKVSHTTKTINYVLINDLPTLVWSANLANIEMHSYLFQATAQNIPTHVIFDLDPGPGRDVFDCIELALVMNEIFKKMKLLCYPKVSGSKGLQLHLPLNTKCSFDITSTFAHAVAVKLEELLPDKVVSKMTKTLRKGKILVDWSQNSKSKTTVSVYSMRAKRDVPYISLPFKWEELKKALKSRDEALVYLSPDDAVRRLKKVGDLFSPVLTKKQSLTQEHIELIEDLTGAGSSRKRAAKSSLLSEYVKKRDFTKTSEPQGKVRSSSASPIFVIQKHAASHLHYDFRLEMHGVLKSWAIPKGPPLKAGERRLAMHVEDHPIAYSTFEGTIPKGNYGGGTVMVWDYGTYSVDHKKPYADYKKGRITVNLKGKKLQGRWILVRDSYEPKRWFMMKGREAKILVTGKALELSARTHRSLSEIAKANDAIWDDQEEQRKPGKKNEKAFIATSISRKLKKTKPKFLSPMKAIHSKTIPHGKGWLYEVKYDGYRALIGKSNQKITLWSRNGKSFNTRYPSIIADAETVNAETFLIDGEIIAQDHKGIASFQALQNYQTSQTTHTLSFYAFDLLNYDGYSLLHAPLEKRRELLERVIEGSNLRLSKTFSGKPEKLAQQVTKIGLEGIIAKRKDSLYVPDTRSKAWRKYKTVNEQELVIGGYSKKSFSTFSTLLVGFYENGKLYYAGKVNGGFTPDLRKETLKKLKPLIRKKCPFVNLPEKSEGRWGNGLTAKRMHECTWVMPKLVCVVRFTEWTENDHLRHAAFISLRDDKEPKEIGRES